MLSPCGRYLCLSSIGNDITLYETRTGTILQKVIGSPYGIKNIKFSADSRKLIFGSTQRICLWNIR